MHARRRFLAAVGTLAMTATAGCGFLLGNESLTFAADPAPVSDSALSGSGYEEQSVSGETVERTFSVADQERTVEVTNQLARYERTISVPTVGERRGAVFTTFASPEVSVLGKEFNPLSDMSSRDVLSRFDSQYEGIEVGDQVGSTDATLLGETVTVSKYDGSAELEGSELPVYIHVTEVVRHEGGYVVALAIYPQQLSGEEETVIDLIEGVEHSD